MAPMKITIKKRKLLKPKFTSNGNYSGDGKQEDNNGCLCFFLGLLFGPFGLLLAAIVGKAGGLISAIWGFLLFLAIIIVGYLLIGLIALMA